MAVRMSVGWVGGPSGGLLSDVLLAGLSDSLAAAGFSGDSPVALPAGASLAGAVAELPAVALSPSASSDVAVSNQLRFDV
jgi:hypothetical protein